MGSKGNHRHCDILYEKAPSEADGAGNGPGGKQWGGNREGVGGVARLTVLSEQMAVAPPIVSQADRTLWEQGKGAQVRIGAPTRVT